MCAIAPYSTTHGAAAANECVRNRSPPCACRSAPGCRHACTGKEWACRRAACTCWCRRLIASRLLGCGVQCPGPAFHPGSCDDNGIADGRKYRDGPAPCRVGQDFQAASAGRPAPRAFGGRRCAHAGGPDQGPGLQALTSVDDASALHSVTALSQYDFDADTFQRALRVGREIVGKARQHAGPCRRSGDDAAPSGCRYCGSSGGSVSCASSAMVPASSTPVGPAPTMTKVRSAARRSGSLSRSARSERHQDAAPQRGWRPSSVFRPGAKRLPFVMAKVGVTCAGSENEGVIRQRVAVIEHYTPGFRIHAGHRGETRS